MFCVILAIIIIINLRSFLASGGRNKSVFNRLGKESSPSNKAKPQEPTITVTGLGKLVVTKSADSSTVSQVLYLLLQTGYIQNHLSVLI